MVLGGVTRRKAIDIINASGLNLIEKAWKYTEIQEKADALFLTGTSPKIIPVAKCDGIEFNTENAVVRGIMNGYDQMIKKYIDARR
jgi:branched-chain amino acid aminotransferase